MIGKLGLAAMAAAAVLGAAPVSAQLALPAAAPATSASDLRELDVMLMVSALRCRFGADDFMAEYSQFAAQHRETLGRANASLLADLAAAHGAKGAANELDRISIRLANRYGNGHPWLDCAQLRQVTRDLAMSSDAELLTLEARRLVGSEPYAEMQLAAR